MYLIDLTPKNFLNSLLCKITFITSNVIIVAQTSFKWKVFHAKFRFTKLFSISANTCDKIEQHFKPFLVKNKVFLGDFVKKDNQNLFDFCPLAGLHLRRELGKLSNYPRPLLKRRRHIVFMNVGGSVDRSIFVFAQ